MNMKCWLLKYDDNNEVPLKIVIDKWEVYNNHTGKVGGD